MLPTLEKLKQPPFYHEMILVEGGSFMMGDETYQPIHEVTLSAFYMGKYPVTQALWKAVMGYNPSGFIGDTRPVGQVSWRHAQEFIQRLNKRTGKEYRLPTEAEWEYAAKGGNKSNGFLYSGSDQLDVVGWYEDNSNESTQPVGELKPNELGLYDMSGNVWEWCNDWHDNYSSASQINPQGPERGPYRVCRSGSWVNAPHACRPSYRNCLYPGSRFTNLGFRLAATLL